MTSFNAQTFFNPSLAGGAVEVDAVITVNASTPDGAPQAAASNVERVELIVVDTSGSMAQPDETKIREARKATVAAVNVVSDGTYFAIIAGASDARVVFPRAGGLAKADASTRAQAIEAANRLSADGGTNIPAWLELARTTAKTKPGAIAHMLLLTDGQINPDALAYLPGQIEACKGVFQADCRGVGADWTVDQLREIAEALLGTVDIIKSAAEMEADFRTIIKAAMAKVVSPELSIWVPKGGEVVFAKQVAPTILAITADPGKAPNPLTSVYTTGGWADGESRDYHVRIKLPAAGSLGETKMAARVKVLVDGNPVCEQPVAVTWTDDLALSTRRVKEVDLYTGKAELAQAIQEGLAAQAAGDQATATAKLGRAAQLAKDDPEMTARLKKVADFTDVEAASGTVRLKGNASKEDAMALDTGSTRTVRAKKA